MSGQGLISVRREGTWRGKGAKAWTNGVPAFFEDKALGGLDNVNVAPITDFTSIFDGSAPPTGARLTRLNVTNLSPFLLAVGLSLDAAPTEWGNVQTSTVIPGFGRADDIDAYPIGGSEGVKSILLSVLKPAGLPDVTIYQGILPTGVVALLEGDFFVGGDSR